MKLNGRINAVTVRRPAAGPGPCLHLDLNECHAGQDINDLGARPVGKRADRDWKRQPSVGAVHGVSLGIAVSRGSGEFSCLLGAQFYGLT